MRPPQLFLLLLSSIIAPATPAQDPVSVNPSIARVEFENARVRVLRVHYQPHQKFALHEHPAKVALCLTQFHTRRLAPDGTSTEGTCPAGTVVWREPEKHAVENLDAAPSDTIEIELKYAHEPAVVATKQPHSAPEPMPVSLEPHHHPLFENQYVRVMEATIAPGDTTLYHTHSVDTVFVDLTDSQTQSQSLGGAWGPAEASKSGAVEFDDHAQHPLTHRVKNVGSAPNHFLLVELLPWRP